jgi:hypothetical protein
MEFSAIDTNEVEMGLFCDTRNLRRGGQREGHHVVTTLWVEPWYSDET